MDWGLRKCAFLASSQEMLIMLVWGSSLENCILCISAWNFVLYCYFFHIQINPFWAPTVCRSFCHLVLWLSVIFQGHYFYVWFFKIILAGNHSYFLTDWCELMQLTPIISSLPKTISDCQNELSVQTWWMGLTMKTYDVVVLWPLRLSCGNRESNYVMLTSSSSNFINMACELFHFMSLDFLSPRYCKSIIGN